ncbi:VWA domain-containing protein [Candidatus Omnitrophota bacterium]
MRFASTYYAFGFWIIVFLILFFVYSSKSRKNALLKFAKPESLDEISATTSARRRKIRSALILLVVTFSVLALMRPQWGFQWQEVTRRGLDILIAVDVSKSMLASDIRPNRLERSKLAVKDLIKKLRGDRVGLIAFSGTAFMQSPLTLDYSGFLLALNNLNTDIIPRGGTSISSAIKIAIDNYKDTAKKFKTLIIITDGEDHEGDSAKLAQEARKEGIKIFCIGIGTSEGELIQVTDDKGKKSFLKDKQGNVIKSRLNESILQKIALTTGGIYVRSSGAEFGLDRIYEGRLSKMEKRDMKAQMNKFYFERFQIPLGIALLLLIIEPLIGDKKRR